MFGEFVKKFVFFVCLILCLCCSQQNASTLSSCLNYTDAYNELTNNAEPIDINALHIKTCRRNQYFDKGYLEERSAVLNKWVPDGENWKVRDAQIEWNTLFKTMNSYSEMNLAMCRLVEWVVFSAYAMRLFDLKKKKLNKFCAIFTYCVQNKIITENDNDFINAIKNHTCVHQTKESGDYFEHESVFFQIPYIATITCRLEDKLGSLENDEKKVFFFWKVLFFSSFLLVKHIINR